MVDYVRYYDRERYLFEDVHQRFHAEQSVGAFDFFSIVIWKANRAKSKIAHRLQAKATPAHGDLDMIVRRLTASLYQAPDHRERLRLLLQDWGFLLPMASAILAVFWPDDFTIYDTRVCDQLKRYEELAGWSNFERVWQGYCEYRGAVRSAVSNDLPTSAKGADVVYTDVWAGMGLESEAQSRKQHFQPYQVNQKLMLVMAHDAIILHCLPAHYGEEIDYPTSRLPNSVIFDQAENRLHAQKALLAALVQR
jgi:hypothetical protein